MDKKKNIFKQLKELKKTEKKVHHQEVNKIISEVKEEKLSVIHSYNQLKKLYWWEYIISLFIGLLLIGISLLIGLYAFQDSKKIHWVISGFLGLALLIWWGLGWYKNKSAARYYNDARRRYAPTFSDEEAKIKKTRKMLLLIAITLLVSIVIFISVQ